MRRSLGSPGAVLKRASGGRVLEVGGTGSSWATVSADWLRQPAGSTARGGGGEGCAVRLREGEGVRASEGRG